ncbi:hypothetical protein ARMGADRAFT_1040862 [Armillaria gallica]|uniref:Uncharacterized protein n=1 Tax=Armillaria gallica TaxID=47427 RepID=A0A2H3C8G6_ARMGA|nr:hypothetical protein ARMGADRAFT_1040862 [Armillaria gallica]
MKKTFSEMKGICQRDPMRTKGRVMQCPLSMPPLLTSAPFPHLLIQSQIWTPVPQNLGATTLGVLETVAIANQVKEILRMKHPLHHVLLLQVRPLLQIHQTPIPIAKMMMMIEIDEVDKEILAQEENEVQEETLAQETEQESEVKHLARLGGRMQEYLGQWLWRGLREDSEIYSWFSTLPEMDQEYMRRNVMNFVNVIKEDFLGDQWQFLMNDVFEVQ